VTVESSVFSIEGSANETATFTLTRGGVSQTAQGTTFRFNVDLSVGLNVFTLTATDLAGNQTVREVKVKRRDGGIVSALKAPIDGAIYSAPATIDFAAEASSQSSSIQRVEFLRDGDLVGSVASAPFEYRLSITVPGSYTLRARAIDQSGATAMSSDVRVHVLDTPERATRAVWSGFQAAIAGGSKAAAMNFIAGGSKVRYQSVLDDLGPIAANVLASLSALTILSADDTFVEYFVNQREEGTGRDLGFFIYFVKETDGIWRILEM
jgi:hypothetical protein